VKSPLESGLAKAGVASAQRHLFICLGPDCADLEASQPLWEHIKATVKSLNLPVMRTKAQCFRVCTGGPILVIYPDGAWYGNMTPERFDRIIQEHVLNGRPVSEWLMATNTLCLQKES